MRGQLPRRATVKRFNERIFDELADRQTERARITGCRWKLLNSAKCGGKASSDFHCLLSCQFRDAMNSRNLLRRYNPVTIYEPGLWRHWRNKVHS